MRNESLKIVVVGSVNLDLAATVSRLPVAGETVTGASLNRFPGGKGANQALAAQRLGVAATLLARVGADSAADEALVLLREGGVDLSSCIADPQQPTGIALIAVGPSGENQIVVAPGANRTLSPEMLTLPHADALIGQLEVPLETLQQAATQFDGFVCLNLAPAMPVPDSLIQSADLVVLNETEAEYYGDAVYSGSGLAAITHGRSGAILCRDGERIAAAKPPTVESVDTTGAGDAFTAALTIALLERKAPQAALEFACAAGAAATTKHGAQPSLPSRAEVERLLGR